jgi:hypothetical protein
VSAAGYAVPPIPEGAELEALIGRCWLPRLHQERQAEFGEFTEPCIGRYNIVGRRA